MRTRQPLTQEQKIQKELTKVAKFNAKFDVESENMPEGFSTGYIGNAKQVNNSIVWDDRSWMVFRAHEGRMGTKEDCMGGYPTEERYKLLPIIKEGLNKNIENCTVWKPIPPDGYIALGHIIDTTPYKTEPIMPSTDIMVCVPNELVKKTKQLKNIWKSKNNFDSINNIIFSTDKYQLNTFIMNNGNAYKLNSNLKGYLCEPFNPKNPKHQTTTTIYNECSKFNDNKQLCKQNIKCKWKAPNCDYKNRSNDDIKKYSFMKIYE